MTEKEIDDILDRASRPSDLDPALLERAKQTVVSNLRPLRPLPPPGLFIAAFLIVFGVILAAGASITAMNGWRALAATDRIAIFAALVAMASLGAIACSREMRPAGGRRVTGMVFVIAVAGLLAIFALILRDYSMQKFVRQGVPCLVVGLAFALPAALIGTVLLRRGYILNRLAAGLAVGTLAGLSGIGVLELHCANLKASHVMSWHVGVVLISALLAGGLLAIWRGANRA